MDNHEAMSNTTAKAAAILPYGLEWFANKERTRKLCKLLHESSVVSFTFAFGDDGRSVRRTKTGHLVQLSKISYEKVEQRTGEVFDFLTPLMEEASLEFSRELMPPRKWEEATKNPRAFLEQALFQATGLDKGKYKIGYVANKGESHAVTVKLPQEYLVEVLMNIDRYHVFARKTVRGEEKDAENVPVWLPTKRNVDMLMQIRDAREHAKRQAGGHFRGISVRYRQGGYQIGVRVVAEHAPTLRTRILPRQMQPVEEAMDVLGTQHYRIIGLPADLDKNSCSRELYRVLRWATIPIREWTKSGSATADWIVAADTPPPRDIFYIRMLGSDTVSPVIIEEEVQKGAKGRIFIPNVGHGSGKENKGWYNGEAFLPVVLE